LAPLSEAADRSDEASPESSPNAPECHHDAFPRRPVLAFRSVPRGARRATISSLQLAPCSANTGRTLVFPAIRRGG